MTGSATRKSRWHSYSCKVSGNIHTHISAPWLDAFVTEQVLEAIDTGKLAEAIKRGRKPKRTRKASLIEARLENLDAEYADGKLSGERFNRMNAKLLEQLREAQTVEHSNGIDLPAALARNLTERWPDLDTDTRRLIITAVLERIEVSKAKGTHGPVDPSRVKLVWRG